MDNSNDYHNNDSILNDCEDSIFYFLLFCCTFFAYYS